MLESGVSVTDLSVTDPDHIQNFNASAVYLTGGLRGVCPPCLDTDLFSLNLSRLSSFLLSLPEGPAWHLGHSSNCGKQKHDI